MQAGEGELRGFHADPVDVVGRLVGLGIGSVEHDAGGGLDEVTLQHLADEGERTRGAEVALDDLDLVVAGQILDVERTGDVQLLGYLAADLLDAAGRGEVDLLGGEHQRGVAGVYAGKLDVLGDGVFDNLTILCHGVELDFLGVLQELRHDDGVFLGHLGGHLEELLQFVFIVADVHGRSREDVGRTHQDGIAHLGDKALDVFEAGQLLPGGLVDAQLVEHVGELVAVLGTVDGDGRRAQHGH